MNTFSSLGISGVDFIEFAVADLEAAITLHRRMGFSKVGMREIRERGLTSVAMAQGRAVIVLSCSTQSQDPVARFVSTHGEGVFNVALRTENAHAAFEITVNRGATPVDSPKLFKKDFGSLETASIKAFGDVIHTFVSREGTLLSEGFESPVILKPSEIGITEIDHITSNVEKGKLDDWADWYQKIFGLEVTRFFDVKTERTGLLSKVMESPGHALKLPLNEPTNPTSQIQEFLDINHGPGIQHVALLTENILTTVPAWRNENIAFLEGPPLTYYEDLSKRVHNVTEDREQLRALSILVDGDSSGYLLQLFTQNLVGPFFYEIIQRKGNRGFGEGNFNALFQAIERDQERRGVL
ncbi:MAG: 4-hydroxyphenylpyruvate dioxygenase [Proteobacteria bacterium]|nr:4-hydroxyphenylpyruvate dioxygenase [Pseudomonadota bacterium]NDC23549.1 4-hydroxyphenylpyruvate dioxygenase [Pseudomonadota bacterium]NDD03667.1 4-hydroxyphenylpyruvate dioxygenase [Pseudomonadota bacterium]NDG25842.1 4-hydroxyphenylpyruvate dioxygenase [Pseudomonadota bacterium]